MPSWRETRRKVRPTGVTGLPTAEFSHTASGRTATFTDLSFDVPPGTIASWAWEFGDGATSALQNPSRLYAADGTYLVRLTVTDNDGNPDSVEHPVSVAAAGGPLGIPFGAYGVFRNTTELQTHAQARIFNCSLDFMSAATAISRINAARTLGIKLITAMTGGGHAQYVTNGQFDLNAWKHGKLQTGQTSITNGMDVYNTPAIKAAVAAEIWHPVTNPGGVILGNNIMDEPTHASWGSDVMKVTLDEMARYVKSIFPGLPVGVASIHWHDRIHYYADIDFLIDQFDWWQSPTGPGGGQSGNIVGWIAEAENMVADDGLAGIVWSHNIVHGGRIDITQPIEWICPETGDDDIRFGTRTSGKGTSSPGCRPTPRQIEEWQVLQSASSASLAVIHWKYDAHTLVTGPYAAQNFEAMQTAAAACAARPQQSWLRP
jgi:PKD repeat protein